MMLDYLEKQLIRHEGMRIKPYTDTVGKLTIGVGRNLTDVGLSEEEVMVLLKNDINKVVNDLTDYLGWWNTLDESRRIVLMNLCFNLGITRLLGFRKFLLSLQEGDYEKAAQHMEDSMWHKQVKGRAIELEQIMRTGEL